MKPTYYLAGVLTCLGVLAMPMLSFSFNNGDNGSPSNGEPISTMPTRLLNISVDFSQAANNHAGDGLGNIRWLGSIVQSSNSIYYEGMSNHQRVLFTDIPQTTGNVHSLRFYHETTKGGTHGYDFLTGWGQATAYNQAALGVNYQINECGDNIGNQPDFAAICTDLHNGLYMMDVALPDDPYVDPQDGAYQQRINAYEALYGNRVMRVYANAPIISIEFCGSPVHDGPPDGDSDITYVLKVTGNNTDPITELAYELAGHLAVSGNNTTGLNWGVGQGAGAIPGGSWHFHLDKIGGETENGCDLLEATELGNQDNQIKDIMLPPCPTCTVNGSTGPLCPNTNQIYSVTISGSCPGQSVVTWSFTSNTSGASFVNGNTGSTVTVNSGTTCGAYTLQSSFNCDGCPNNPITCDISATVEDETDPVISDCPVGTIDLGCNPEESAYSCDAARALVSATDNCDGTINWDCDAGDVTENGCYRSQTFTLSASDNCGNAAQCEVTYNWKVDLEAPSFSGCPGNAIDLGCNPTQDVLPTCDDALALVTASDNCDGNITPTCGAGDVTSDGCNRSQIFTLTATDACRNSAECRVTYTWTIDNPPVITCPATLNLFCGQSTVPSIYPTATDDCGAVPTFSYQDVSIPATCGGTDGAAYLRVWTATGGCGLTATCEQTVTCGPCVTACALTQGFYGSSKGKFYYEPTGQNMTAVQLIQYALDNNGSLVLGNPNGAGGSLTVPPSAAICLNSLMPGGGVPKIFPSDLDLTGCSVPAIWKKNGKFSSILWGQAITLWLNAKLFDEFNQMELANACVPTPQLILDANPTITTISDLLTYTSNVLGDNPHLSNADLGVLAGYLGDLHNYFDECAFECIYYDPQGRPGSQRELIPGQITNKEIVQSNNFKVVPNPMWDQFTVTLDKESVGKAVSIMIFNQFGQIVLAENLATLSTEEVQMTASTLQAGIYQISVRIENQHPMVKTIVVIKR